MIRKFLRHSVAAAAVGMIFLSASVSDVNGQNVIGEILRRMDQNNRSIQSIRASVTMVKHNPQLNVSDTTTGTTSYIPKTAKIAKNKMYVRIDWTQPVEEQISVIGDVYELYRPRLQQVITGKVNGSKNNAVAGGALGFMSMSKQQLIASYDVNYIGEEQVGGGVATWHLELIPKTRTSYKSADLWVDANGMPLQAKIIEHNNDSTTVLLSNIQKNITLSSRIFSLDYPSSVKKIKA